MKKNYLELREQIKDMEEIERKGLEEKKRNIHNNYILAKLDFVIIDNMQDTIDTYTRIINELDKLKERIVKRNNEERG